MINNTYKIYKNPTVSRVIFQINFNNLFIIENRIGDYQTKIMEKFPESSLILRRDLLFANVGPDSKMEEIPMRENIGRKIWQFKSSDNYVLSITTNSLDIVSRKHQQYYTKDVEGFRDIIQFAVDHFLSLIPIKKIKRMGLRYTDNCPLPPLDTINETITSISNEGFQNLYNTALPINKFNLENLGKMKFEAELKRGHYFLIYKESIGNIESNTSGLGMILDFDGFSLDITPDNYLNILDDLHDMIHNEWESTLKQPVKDWMDRDEVNNQNE